MKICDKKYGVMTFMMALGIVGCAASPAVPVPMKLCSSKVSSNQAAASTALNIVNGQQVTNSDKIERSTLLLAITHKLSNGTESNFICTAVVASKNILLTAAHCFEKPKVQGATVNSTLIGATTQVDVTKGLEKDLIEVESTQQHPEWNGVFHDIAFVKLKGTLPAGVVPAGFEFDLSKLKKSTPVVLVGYGVTGDNATNSSGIKRRTDSMVDQIISSATFPNTQIVNQVRLLDTSGQARASCFGDSGGPGFVKDTSLVFGVTQGINSTVQPLSNMNCSSGDVNYTLVAPYREWIEQTAGIKLQESWTTEVASAPATASSSIPGAVTISGNSSNATASIQGSKPGATSDFVACP